MPNFDFFRKGSGNRFSATFGVCFLEKNADHLILYQLIKFHYQVVFIPSAIVKFKHCNCDVPDCDVINFEISLFF